MKSRPTHTYVIGAALLGSLACTSLLGDFAVGVGTKPPVPPVEAGPRDASAEAGPTSEAGHPVFGCSATADKISLAMGPQTAPPRRLWTFTSPAAPQTFFVFAAFERVENTSLLSGLSGYVVTAGSGLSAVPLPEIKSKGITIVAVKPYAQGVAALVFEGGQFLMYLLPAGDPVWTAWPISQTIQACEPTGDFVIVDSVKKEALALVAYRTGAMCDQPVNVSTYYTLNGNSTGDRLPTPYIKVKGVMAPQVVVPRQSIALAGSGYSAMVFPVYPSSQPSPAGLAGSLGVSSIFYSLDKQGRTTETTGADRLPGTTDDGVLYGLAFASLPNAGGYLAFSGGIPLATGPSLYVTSGDPATLPKADPTTFTATTVMSPDDLPGLNANAHWDIFRSPTSAHLLTVAPGKGGANFFWFDATGKLVISRNATDTKPLLPDATNVVAIDACLAARPDAGKVADLAFAFQRVTGMGTYELIFQRVHCE